MKRRWQVSVILVLVAAAAVYPFETTAVPEWRIKVIDETGSPFAGARVVEQWDHYSLGQGGGEEKCIVGWSSVVAMCVSAERWPSG